MERTIEVKMDLREKKRLSAEAFRERMSQQGTFVVRLLSSPGAGKTTLLQITAEALRENYRVGILVGDVETERDAERLAPFAPSHQITTGGACHLELPLIERSLPSLGPETFDFLFIEDIGNLICPASHDLGEHLRIVLLSTTEGDDKPGKYPKMFRSSDVVVISKTDLLPYVPFSVENAKQDALQIQPRLSFFELSASQQQGIDEWTNFLIAQREARFSANSPQ